jgi:hypothetical protein
VDLGFALLLAGLPTKALREFRAAAALDPANALSALGTSPFLDVILYVVVTRLREFVPLVWCRSGRVYA